MTPRAYWMATRQPRYAVLFAAPLFVLYEAASWMMAHEQAGAVRNGADVLLRTLFAVLGGPRGLALFTVVLAGAGAAIVWRDALRRGGALRPGAFVLMLAESGVWALLLGGATSAITATLLDPLAAQVSPIGGLALSQRLVLAAGAGLYEELVFRVLLVAGFAALGRAAGWQPRTAVGVAIVGSAAVFSAFHYVGPYGEPFQVASFTFRAVAGVLLSGLYVARGFGIAAWSHALYDAMVLTA